MEKQKWENNYPTPGGMSLASHCYIQKAVGEALELAALALETSGQELVQMLHPSTQHIRL